MNKEGFLSKIREKINFKKIRRKIYKIKDEELDKRRRNEKWARQFENISIRQLTNEDLFIYDCYEKGTLTEIQFEGYRKKLLEFDQEDIDRLKDANSLFKEGKLKESKFKEIILEIEELDKKRSSRNFAEWMADKVLVLFSKKNG